MNEPKSVNWKAIPLEVKITKPEDLCSDPQKVLKDVVNVFESQLVRRPKDSSFYTMIIRNKYNREICDAVEQIYKEAGWSGVKCYVEHDCTTLELTR